MRAATSKAEARITSRVEGPQVPVKKEGSARQRVKVLIADDDPLVRAAVSVMLHGEHVQVAGEATNGEEAIEMARNLRPQLLLLDLSMPKLAGLAALPELKDVVPMMKIIVLTLAIDARQILQALQLGASGIVLKESARETLPAAMRTVLQGKFWVNKQAEENVQSVIQELMRSVEQRPSKRNLLSAREQQVVAYIVEGCTNKDIAKMLETSEQVVKNYLGKIFDKLGVFNRLELALYALDNQLVKRTSNS